MKIAIVFAFVLLLPFCAQRKIASESQPIEHDIWDTLLQKHVDAEGWVDYHGFQTDSLELNRYLELLSSHHPSDKHWSSDEQLAYWINAYNAYTVKLVADHYPVTGIKTIKNGIPFVSSVWDIKFIQIEDQTYDLNNIEHGIIRKHFAEPRIHFAVNCASVSCPRLSNRAYVAEQLDSQLEEAARSFINDESRNKIGETPARLSSIFSWFKGDFTKKRTLRDFINLYAEVEIKPNTDIKYLDYDWGLNDQK